MTVAVIGITAFVALIFVGVIVCKSNDKWEGK